MDRADVIILGGGLVGLALAAALDSSGLSAIVVDPADPDAAHRRRVRRPHQRGLVELDADARGDRRRRPSARARLPDPPHRGRRRARARAGCTSTPSDDDEPLGWMHENRHLRAALQRARRGRANDLAAVEVARRPTVDRGEHGVTVALADGRKLTRAAAGRRRGPQFADPRGRRDPRRALAIRPSRRSSRSLRHERPHDHVAYEIFYPGGPFALLPMTDDDGGHRSAIVWSVPRGRRARLAVAERRRFRRRGRGGDGRLPRRDRAARAALVLSARLPPCRARSPPQRLALVGDAAHAIHPIAGQGLNLGFRDAAALAQVLVEGARLGLDLGDRQLLDRYQRWRALDALLVAVATDGLTRIYGVPGRAASAVRRFGMGLVGRIAPAARTA